MESTLIKLPIKLLFASTALKSIPLKLDFPSILTKTIYFFNQISIQINAIQIQKFNFSETCLNSAKCCRN